MNTKKKILLIGWDAADWDVIDDLLQQGRMPALKKILEKGVRGKISTFDPPVSPMLWTSIATGKYPEKHGILGFAEPSPDGKGMRPLFSTSRKVKAIWNMFNQCGLKSNVIGWWPSHPAEPINGAMVSNFYQMVTEKEKSKWKMDEGTVYPEKYENILKELRFHPTEITLAHILPFVPDLALVDQEKDKTLDTVAKLMSHGVCIQNAATWLMENTEWDFTAVYFDMIDHFSHLGMRYRPPYRENVNKDMYEKYKHLVDSAYVFQDMMLDRQLQLAGENTTVMLISDHGFHSGSLRPLYYPKEPAGPTFEHSPFGIFCFCGPGIKTNEKIFGASVMDITPTLLAYMGLPLGKDMDGKPLLQCFSGVINPKYIESWENFYEGDAGMHDPSKRMDAWAENEAMKQLIELGYVEKPEGKIEKQIENAKRETKYFLARNLMFNRRHEKAYAELKEISAFSYRYKLLHAQCCLELKKFSECKELITELWNAEKPFRSFLHYLEGKLLIATNRAHKSIPLFREALKSAPRSAELYVQLGLAWLSMARYEKSEESFKEAIRIDSRNPFAHYGLGLACSRQKKWEDATDRLLEAVELQNYFPQAHYHLGVALLECGERQHAIDAFLYALALSPSMLKAHQQLKNIFSETEPGSEREKLHEAKIKEVQKGEITIVTGLNRSGRSLVMQLLESAGGNVLYKPGTPSEFYPKGRFECPDLNNTGNEQIHITGKIIKADINQLVNMSHLYFYKIIVVNRNFTEILSSQQKVSGLKGYRQKAYPSGLDHINRQQLQIMEDWLGGLTNCEIKYVDFNELMEQNDEELALLFDFTGLQGDVKKTAETVINNDWYKERHN